MIPELEKAAEILRIFEEVLPDLVWKDVEPKSEQGLETVMTLYNCQFFQGTSHIGQKKHPWFVTLTVYTVPTHEAASEDDDGKRFDGAVAVDGSLVRLTFELAKKAAEFAEKAVG